VALGHRYRFASQVLPTIVFSDPIAFARAPEIVAQTAWERAGSLLAAAERERAVPIRARVIRAAPFTAIHLEPPFPREVGEACAIVVVGRGDGERELLDVRYLVLGLGVDTSTGAPRFVAVSHFAQGEPHTTVDDVPPDVAGFIDHCVALAAGARPARDPARSPQVAPWYWWHVARGVDAMRAFVTAPEHEAWSVVNRCPILLLPEVVEAAEQVLGPSRATAGLREMQASLRGTAYFGPFHRLLATALASERGGSPRVNVERALVAIAEVRASINDPGEVGRATACEASLRAQLAALGIDPRRNYDAALALFAAARARPAEPADHQADERAVAAVRAALEVLAKPGPSDPAWNALFLDDAELHGFHRTEDETPATAPVEDRAYAQRGGVGTASTTWLGNEAAAVYRIADTRWLFPSVKAAAAFVQAILPHANEGLPPAPTPSLGDAAHAWGDPRLARGSTAREARQVLVLRVGRLVAKLHVTEGPRAAKQFQALIAPMLVPYGEAIVRRARLALSRYWLAIARGLEAANRFVEAAPRGATQLFSQFPILLLPQFPTAMASLGESHRSAADRLHSLQASFKSNWSAYRDALRALVRALLDERAGEPIVNADAALALVLDHRRVDSDYAWASIEAECREGTVSTLSTFGADRPKG